MVDYTTSKSGSGASGFGLLLGAAVVVVVVGYALIAGSGAVPTDPADPAAIIPTQTEPAVDPALAVPITD